MSVIGPGVWVEVIPTMLCDVAYKARPWRVAFLDADHARCELCDGFDYVILEDEPSASKWCVCEVRPIGRDDPDLIETLKQPAPPAVRELIDA